MNGRLLSSVFLALLITPAGSPAQSLESEAAAREEYAVYSVALEGLYEEFQFHTLELVISNPTIKGFPVTKKSVQFVIPGASTGTVETFADYSERNKTNRWLERRLDLNFKYVIVDIAEIKKLLHNFDPFSDWTEFSEKYRRADGFVQLSRVGLNPRMDEALVYVVWSCGSLCGYSEAMLLSKQDRTWKIVNRSRVLIF